RDLVAEVSGAMVSLSWAAPDASATSVLIVRFPLSDGVDGRPEAGVGYEEGDELGGGQVVFSGSGTSMMDIPPCRNHIYAGWVRDAGGRWSTPAATREVTGLPGMELSSAG